MEESAVDNHVPHACAGQENMNILDPAQAQVHRCFTSSSQEAEIEISVQHTRSSDHFCATVTKKISLSCVSGLPVTAQ